MHYKFEKRGQSFRIRLAESVKGNNNKPKTRFIKNFGSIPSSTPIGSPEGIEYLKGVLNSTERLLETPGPWGAREPTPQEYADFMSRVLENEDATSQNLGVGVLEAPLRFFNLDEFFKRLEKETKRAYPLFEYYKFILFHQIISPESLLEYYRTQDAYSLFLPDGGVKEADLYDFLTFFYEHRLDIQGFMFKSLLNYLGPQRVDLVYYDGSNFYTYAAKADADKIDEFGAAVKRGLRKFGLSKESRHQPLVSIGVLSSESGIPLFYTVFPGNEQEISHIGTDIRKLRNGLIDHGDDSRILLCADAGNYSGDLVWRLAGENKQTASPELKEGDAYIIGRGYKKVDDKTQEWAREPEGYYPLSKGRLWRLKKDKRSMVTYVKSRVVTVRVRVKLESGKYKYVNTRQLQVAIFSTKRRHRKVKAIEEQLERAIRISENPAELKRLQKKLGSQYLKAFGVMEPTGEVTEDIRATIDQEILQADIEGAGIFIITSSETHLAAGKVVSIYRNKNISEQIFHYLKDTFDVRPIRFWTPEHIIAHIDLCVQAVVLVNVMRIVIEDRTGENLSPKAIQSLLRELRACPIGYSTFRITGINEKIKKVLSAFHLNLDKPVYTKKELEMIFSGKE